MRISDWSSDVCSSDLQRYLASRTARARAFVQAAFAGNAGAVLPGNSRQQAGRSRRCWRGRSPGRTEPTYGAACVRKHQLKSGDLENADAGCRGRTEERRVGKEGVSTVRFRWAP